MGEYILKQEAIIGVSSSVGYSVVEGSVECGDSTLGDSVGV